MFPLMSMLFVVSAGLLLGMITTTMVRIFKPTDNFFGYLGSLLLIVIPAFIMLIPRILATPIQTLWTLSLFFCASLLLGCFVEAKMKFLKFLSD